MDIILASHTVIGSHFVVGSHHLAWNFHASGNRVVHLSTPITPARLILSLKSDLVRKRFGAWRSGWAAKPGEIANLVPMALLPWQWAQALRRVDVNPLLWTLPSIRMLLARCGMDRPDLLIIDQPRFVGLEQMLQAGITLYRATDLYAQMTDDASSLAAERRILAHADGWIATSLPVFEHLNRLAPDKPSLLVENGVDVDHLRSERPFPIEYAHIPSPRLVYVGALDHRFDVKAAMLLAARFPQASVVIIGPKDGSSRANAPGYQKPENLFFLGPKPYSDLPAYLQHADVGLILLNDHPANAGRSPMKLYEYAAAGLPVVSRNTREIARRAEPFVFLYEEPEALEDAVAMALRCRHHLRPQIEAAAMSASWMVKADQIRAFARALTARDGTIRAQTANMV